MALIILKTLILAPRELCFDLSRSVGIHLLSARDTGEKVIGGRTEGLFEKGDTVTWQARHLGATRRLTVQITELDPPFFFEDRMLKGAFRFMQHRHYFLSRLSGTLMKDVFEYKVPAGFLGRMVDDLYLKKYLTKFLQERNRVIKEEAERISAGDNPRTA